MLATIRRWIFDVNPTLGVAITYGSLNALGDFCAQFFFSSASYNVARTLRFLIFGVGIAPLAGMWNAYLEHHYPLRASPITAEPIPLESVTIDFSPKISDSKLHRRTPSGSVLMQPLTPVMESNEVDPSPTSPPITVNKAVLIKRLAIDQVFMAPISFVIFLTAMGLMEGLGPKAILQKNLDNLVPILLVNWRVWPIIQIVMFLYVPLKHRVPLAGVCGVIWTIYLSWQTA